MFNNLKSGFNSLSNKKPLVELIVALLTIPVLVTVILLNFTNLNGKNNDSTNSGSTPVVIEKDANSNGDVSEAPGNNPTVVTPNPEICKDQVGPVSIASPGEGTTASDNPANFIIKYQDSAYCSVVWSYRINNGTWSEFGSNSPAVYNLPSGPVKFELRVQSTVSNDQELLTRNFIYENPQASPSP